MCQPTATYFQMTVHIAHCLPAQHLQWKSVFAAARDDKMRKVNPVDCKGGRVTAMWFFAKLFWIFVNDIHNNIEHNTDQ